MPAKCNSGRSCQSLPKLLRSSCTVVCLFPWLSLLKCSQCHMSPQKDWKSLSDCDLGNAEKKSYSWHTQEAFENVGSTLRNTRNGRWYSKGKKLYGKLMNNCEKPKSYSNWKVGPLVQRHEKQHLQMSGSVEADSPGEKQLQNCLQFTESEGYLRKKFLFKQGACACDHNTYTQMHRGNCIKGCVLPWNTRNLKAEIMEQVCLLFEFESWHSRHLRTGKQTNNYWDTVIIRKKI